MWAIEESDDAVHVICDDDDPNSTNVTVSFDGEDISVLVWSNESGMSKAVTIKKKEAQ